jgi:hypothetical protein
MTDREGTLGFRPQRENAYNKFLPRHEDLDKECGCVSSWDPTMVAECRSGILIRILVDPHHFTGPVPGTYLKG